jgi:hypothetical protein
MKSTSATKLRFCIYAREAQSQSVVIAHRSEGEVVFIVSTA